MNSKEKQSESPLQRSLATDCVQRIIITDTLVQSSFLVVLSFERNVILHLTENKP